MNFKNSKKIKMKYINALKIEQNKERHQFFLMRAKIKLT